MNDRGMHVTQESLLHWERDCSPVSGNCEEFLSIPGRTQWVTQSLVRPMPKNPFAFAYGCNGLTERFPFVSEVKLAREYDDEKIQACNVAVECTPPYTHEGCADLGGCFSQEIDQKGCYNTDMETPAIVGISFNFLSSLGDSKLDACLEQEPKCMSKQSMMLREATEAAEAQGAEVLTLAQTRSNLFRWAISRVFHARDFDNYIIKAIEFTESGDKFVVHDVDGLLRGPVKRMEQLLQMSLEVSDNTKILFYEDLARDVGKSIEAVQLSYKNPVESVSDVLQEDVAPDENVKDQHPGGLGDYVENLEEFRKQVRKSQPCLYTMALDETPKDTTLILPLKMEDSRIRVDFSRDCCFGDSETFVRTVKDYVQAGLDC
eukprot:CAMPEP_0184487954 /NCGR_PEP_ID=MMETSP0113_2-20130426/10435_1 /TAXON_ID=91329 /ORGANISM="Norrisiella sphaerica, Strain BC52" /LENGTH=374 /DNA_ID=CAMNT_0026870397 /DNA_START=266 /DNA_END=1390 /DNA_ORIENTATION=-